MPGCKRTEDIRRFEHKNPEWVCKEHWKPIPRDARLAFQRYVRQQKRFGVESFTEGEYNAARRLWRWLTKKAIERAVGIG